MKIIKDQIKSRLVVLLLILTLLAPILSVDATQATRDRHREAQRDAQAAQRDVRTQQNLLAGTRHEMSQLTQRIQELNQQQMEVVYALESIELSLLDTQLRIEEAEMDLEVARAEYDLQFEILRTRVREIHEHGSVGFLDLLFGAENILDFFARWEFIRVVAQFDRDLLANIQEQENIMTQHIDDLSRWHNMVEDLQFQYNRTSEDLAFLIEEHSQILIALATDEANQAEFLALLQEEERRTQADYSNMRAALRREESEIARANANREREERMARLNDFNGTFQWPIPTHSYISSPFGMRVHPITRVNRMHTGIDVPAPTGTRLIAAADGYVRFAGWSSGYGQTIIIDHGNGYSTLYAHNSRNRVTTGQAVTRGQHIADVGSTGMSTGPHVHFEIRMNNSHRNPMNYFPR